MPDNNTLPRPFTEPYFVIESQTKSKKRILYLFGFNDEFIANIPLEYNGAEYKVIKKSEPVSDLYANAEVQDNSLAVIYNLDALAKDNYQVLNDIKQIERLKNSPFVVINQNNTSIDIEDALKRGIDDCYSFPFRWEDVLSRVEFLIKNKKELEEAVIETKSEFKIPTGKRIADIVLASGALLFLAPVLLIIAACIKLTSKGPILYSSKRAGTSYRVFDFLKFRSMVVDADKKLKELEHLNQYTESTNGTTSTFKKIKNDPRVTGIGKIIRKTSLDELPQLINVLRGDMSIIGNRPLPLYEAKALTTDNYAMRFIAPAGLTGLWQVSKRGKSDMSDEERIGLDIEYAVKHSFLMDAKIIAKNASCYDSGRVGIVLVLLMGKYSVWQAIILLP